MTAEALLVYCTCPDRETATTIAGRLIDERLAACVTISTPVTSVYHWQGACETAEELQLLIKTTRPRYPELERRIQTLHPYELPEIVAVTVERGLPGYLNWVNQCTEE
ncbi:MAG: divalent-cation tolerance protein CutA [Candidatus Sedimenticola sp. (ex Thyasira tokunagai)]